MRRRNSDQIAAREGKWYMRTDSKSNGAEISEDVARIVKAALWLQGRQDAYKEKFDPSSDVVLSINCHKTAFHALGLIDRTEAVTGESSLEAFLMPRESFAAYDTVEALGADLLTRLNGKMGLVQICNYYDKPEHTFIASADEKGDIVCFEKEEYGGRFRVVSLSAIFSAFPTRKWAGDTLDNLENPREKIAERKRIDEEPIEIVNV